MFFFPFLGLFGYNFISYFLTNDFLYFDKYIAKKYPDAKITISNFFLESSIVVLDPSMIKEF